MLPRVILINKPTIIWDNWLCSIKEATDSSPTTLLDKQNRFNGDYYSFIASLGFFSENKGPEETIKTSPSILKHLQFSFLIICEQDFFSKIYRESTLSVCEHIDTKVMVVSGTLFDWRDAIILFTNEKQHFELRYIFDMIYLLFDSLELSCIIQNRRQEYLDKTFGFIK